MIIVVILMKIAIASDHGGTDLKIEIARFLDEKGYIVIDRSPVNTPTDDYPDFAYKIGKSIQDGECELGILLCRSGIGMAITANKMKGVYAGCISNLREAVKSRTDDGVNVACIGGDDELTLNTVKELVEAFLSAESLNDERHQRRFYKVLQIESGEYNV